MFISVLNTVYDQLGMASTFYFIKMYKVNEHAVVFKRLCANATLNLQPTYQNIIIAIFHIILILCGC